MSQWMTTFEMIKMPATNDDLARLRAYINQKYGSQGWAIAGLSTVASSAALLFAFQKPVVADEFLTEVPEAEDAANEITTASPRTGSRSTRRRTNG
jgi:hypothetical protein